MIVLDGRNVYGINKYELVRKNGNNEIRYLVKYRNSIRRGFENVFDAYVFLESLRRGIKASTGIHKMFQSRIEEPITDYTISEAVEKYLVLYKQQVRFGTYNKAKYYFEKVIVPNLPAIHVSEITNIMVLEFRSRLNSEIKRVNDDKADAKTYSTKSKNDILQHLKSFLSFAIDNFNVDRNAIKNVKIFKRTHEEKLERREKDENMWSIEEYYSFIDSIEKLYGRYSPTYGIYLVIGNKGLRLGECLALKFNDLKFENMLVIDESITRKTENKLFEAGEPKNESSDRKIIIGSGLYEYLMEVKGREQRHYDYDDKWFIFHRPKDG
ncbi:MAG: hypothetical protein IKF80_03445, partial [Erysipelotrichaceae bacterium]|nr:hypothetical protein [Erysipelotrichaceae bacterium]